MANELQLYGDATYVGGTVTAKVYDAAGSQVGTDVSLSEVGSTGIHLGDMPTASKGTYGVRFYLAGALVAQGEIFWDGNNEVTVLDGGGISKQDLDAAVTEITTDINSIPISQIGSRSVTDT